MVRSIVWFLQWLGWQFGNNCIFRNIYVTFFVAPFSSHKFLIFWFVNPTCFVRCILLSLFWPINSSNCFISLNSFTIVCKGFIEFSFISSSHCRTSSILLRFNIIKNCYNVFLVWCLTRPGLWTRFFISLLDYFVSCFLFWSSPSILIRSLFFNFFFQLDYIRLIFSFWTIY